MSSPEAQAVVRSPQEAFDQAVRLIADGNVSVMARKFGLTPWAVSKWRARVPAERCPEIERLTDRKVLCEELRPDIDWAFLRQLPPTAA